MRRASSLVKTSPEDGPRQRGIGIQLDIGEWDSEILEFVVIIPNLLGMCRKVDKPLTRGCVPDSYIAVC